MIGGTEQSAVSIFLFLLFPSCPSCHVRTICPAFPPVHIGFSIITAEVDFLPSLLSSSIFTRLSSSVFLHLSPLPHPFELISTFRLYLSLSFLIHSISPLLLVLFLPSLLPSLVPSPSLFLSSLFCLFNVEVKEANMAVFFFFFFFASCPPHGEGV